MALQEQEREDLLREATALVERVELTCGGAESIFAGFRRDGAASFFLTPARVYQFNAAGELRRGFLDGRLYKADCGRLFQLTRERSEDSVELIRHEMTAAETAEFVNTAREKLAKLHAALVGESFQLVGQVPATSDVVGRIRHWLSALPEQLTIAHSPSLRR
jgi:hypothetical protein